MDQELVIRGGHPLKGTVRAHGAKNAALPIMAGAILTEGTTILHRVPHLKDVHTMGAILGALGVELEWTGPNSLRLTSPGAGGTVAPFDLAQRMRASICILGPLLATRGAAVLPLPGGCVIGERPIDLHLRGLRALGAEIKVDGTTISARAARLRGARVRMAGPRGSTVLGTANVLMAATLAEGQTLIEGAAREPEIQNLAHYLVACGAQISGIGTRRLLVTGRRRLKGAEHALIPDRIEAATFLAAGAITGGEVRVQDVCPAHMRATLRAMRRMGVETLEDERSLTAARKEPLRAAQLATAPYPGLPTDVQPQFSAMLCLAEGASVVTDRVYPHRFTHVEGLRLMGARILRTGSKGVINGVARLQGARVDAVDLRAGAALVLGALAAEGVSSITGLDHVDRGYQDLEHMLKALGADVARREASATPDRQRRSA